MKNLFPSRKNESTRSGLSAKEYCPTNRSKVFGSILTSVGFETWGSRSIADAPRGPRQTIRAMKPAVSNSRKEFRFIHYLQIRFCDMRQNYDANTYRDVMDALQAKLISSKPG